jgi:hypothetical protein
VSDARWVEIDAAVQSAVRHFERAIDIFARFANALPEDRYVLEMAFMHARTTFS